MSTRRPRAIHGVLPESPLDPFKPHISVSRAAARPAAELNGRNDEVRSLTFGAYLTGQWLPRKKINLAQSTWDGYRRKIDPHILPVIGDLRIRRLRAHHLQASTTGCSIDRGTATAGTRDRIGGPSHHPRRPQRCGDSGPGQPERCPRGSCPEASSDPEGRTAGVDSPTVTGEQLTQAFPPENQPGHAAEELVLLYANQIAGRYAHAFIAMTERPPPVGLANQDFPPGSRRRLS